MSRVRTFFLFGYYGQGNVGDDLLLRAVIDGICRIEPSPRFIVRSGGADAGVGRIDAPIEFVDVDAVASDQSKSKFVRLFLTLFAYAKPLRKSDWFVFGGGTLFHERASVAPITLIFLICLLARILGVRIAALGVGVAELHSTLARILLRMIVSLSDVFAVRDDAARVECSKAGAGSKVVVTADLVFSSARRLTKAEPRSGKSDPPSVAISIYSPALLNPADGQRICEALARALRSVLDRGWHVALLIFQHAPNGKKSLDADAIALIVNAIGDHRTEKISQTILDADDTATLGKIFTGADIHCGMRFHGQVLSAIFAKPFVGISVDNKTDAICQLFNMPVLPLDLLNDLELIQSIDLAMTREIDNTVLADCEMNAEKNFVYLAARLSASR